MTTPKTSARDASPQRRLRLPGTADLQNGILILIVLAVGFMAGAASFHHVHDWTLDNSPANTPGWFGWANAVITELIPTASLIEIGRRRRKDAHAKVGYPMFLLVAAVGISLTAQLAIAQPTAFGWMVSALPAGAFFALSKLVFTVTAHRPTDNPVASQQPATSSATSPDITRAEVSPADASTTKATPRKRTPAKKTTPSKKTPAKKTTPPVVKEPVPAAPATAEAPAPAAPSEPEIPAPLLSNARAIAASHRDTHDEPISPSQLAVRLRIPTATATDILTQLENNPTTPATTRPHNGSTVGANA